MKRGIVFLSSRQQELTAYRDVAAEVLSEPHFNQILEVWRFEDQPAGPDVEALYLKGIAQAELIVFIAGKEASEGTAEEIARANELRKDIRAFVLPCNDRDERVHELIALVRQHSTTMDVFADLDVFRTAVRETLLAWLSDRIHQHPPDRRVDDLRDLSAQARERAVTLFRAALISPEIASALADDQNVGALGEDLLPTSEQQLRFAIAPAGAGKSLGLLRAHQRALEAAIDDPAAPIPVHLTAGSVAGTLRGAIDAAVRGLGSIAFNGAYLTLDSLDEVAEARAFQLTQEAAEIARAHPSSRVLLASRIAPQARLQIEPIQIPPLTEAMVHALLRRAGTPDAAHRYQLASARIQEVLGWPLFALSFARGDNQYTSEAELAEALLAQALPRTERRHLTHALLQRLAVDIIDSPTGVVSVERFTLDEQMELVETRLVYERNCAFEIPLRIVAEVAAFAWLAAQQDEAALEKLAGSSADRWMPALVRFVQNLPEGAALDFVLQAIRRDTYLAMRLAERDAVRRSEVRTADQLQSEVVRLQLSLADAFPRIFDIKRQQITVSEKRGRLTVTVATFGEDGRLRGRRGHSADQYLDGSRLECVALMTRVLRTSLDRAIERRGFRAEGVLTEELLWNQARVVLGQGSLYEGTLSLDDLQDRLHRRKQSMVMADGNRIYEIERDALLRKIAALRAAGEHPWRPPFVTGDRLLEDRDRGGWFWNRYSDDAVLARRRAIVRDTWDTYRNIVAADLPGLRARMERFLCMPAVLRERVETTPEHGPVSSTYFVPLPDGSANQHDVEFGEPIEFTTAAEELRGAIRANRPLLEDRLRGPIQHGILRMWGPHPVTDETYRWLTEDLFALGLCSHSQLPGDQG